MASHLDPDMTIEQAERLELWDRFMACPTIRERIQVKRETTQKGYLD